MSTREELNRQAERSLRLGRMDEAIAHYQELAHLAPVDWGLVKQLADLLERAGQREGAARQFARWADYLFVEGFHSKAAALYKKVLKLEPSDEHALWQLGDVSVQLKLRADARVAYQRVAEIRLRRGDAAGAAAARERLAGVDATPLMQNSMQATAPALMAIPAPGAALPIVPPPAPLPSVRPADVSISEAAGLPALSSVQSALADAYPDEHRLTQARAVAEDVLAGDAEAAHTRALPDMLDGEGVEEQHDVRADRLTPSSDGIEVIDDLPIEIALTDVDERHSEVAAPVLSWPFVVDALPALRSGDLARASAASAVSVPIERPPVDFDDQRRSELIAEPYVPPPVVARALTVPATHAIDAMFDWSDLLGRELEQYLHPVPAEPTAPVADDGIAITSTDPGAEPPAPLNALSEVVSLPAAAESAEPQPQSDVPQTLRLETVTAQAPVPDAPTAVEGEPSPDPSCEPAPAADQDTSPVADAFPVPRIGDLRAQPLFAEAAPLQPSFSMPTGWLTESPVPASADAPRRRAPADEFFFDDDATPPGGPLVQRLTRGGP